MKSLFKGYYQPTPDQFKELWEKGTFVFDTNVLLGLYRYKEKSRSDLLSIIANIEDRIWIPHQVGLEFHRGRLGVLARQNKDVDTIKSSIAQSIKSIENKCNELDLDKRHSEVETKSFIERFQDLADSVLTELSEIKPKNLTNNEDEDEILNKISSLFNTAKNSLGLPPESQKVLDAIYKDGDFRAINKIPPSFKDIEQTNKNKSEEKYYSFDSLNYKHGYGDLIVWKQIIDFARENKKKNIIFVTDDKKEDWMRIIDSSGKKIISARPELVSEIFKEAGVETFYIYDTNSFLDYSKEYFDIEVSDETIRDVKNVYYRNQIDIIEDVRVDIDIHDEEFASILDVTKDPHFLPIDKGIDIIKEWLETRYYNVSRVNSAIYDFYGSGQKAHITPIIAKFCNYNSLIELPVILEKIVSLYRKGEVFERYHVLIVIIDPTNDAFDEQSIYSIVKRTFEKRAKRFEGIISLFNIEIEVTVGFISDKDEKFKTIYNYELGNN